MVQLWQGLCSTSLTINSSPKRVTHQRMVSQRMDWKKPHEIKSVQKECTKIREMWDGVKNQAATSQSHGSAPTPAMRACSNYKCRVLSEYFSLKNQSVLSFLKMDASKAEEAKQWKTWTPWGDQIKQYIKFGWKHGGYNSVFWRI